MIPGARRAQIGRISVKHGCCLIVQRRGGEHAVTKFHVRVVSQPRNGVEIDGASQVGDLRLASLGDQGDPGPGRGQ